MTEFLAAGSTGYGSIFRKTRLANGETTTDTAPALPGEIEPAETARPATARRRDSSISSLSELKSNLRRRSASFRGKRAASPSPAQDNLARAPSPEKRSASSAGSRPTLAVSTVPLRQRSAENIVDNGSRDIRPTLSAVETRPPRGIFKQDENKTPPSAQASFAPTKVASRSISATHSTSSSNAHNPKLVVQHINEAASKRISTIEYLRKTHEGRVYWFNALLFEKTELSKMPYFDPKRLSRRATNYLLLGISIPAILDPNSSTAPEYLRAFNALLTEFESYQAIHPSDGSASASLSRARIPQMFKRATVPKGGKRGSSAETLSPQSNADSYGDPRSASSGTLSATSASSATFSAFAGIDQELLPGEEYSFLLTPSLPFDPDYFETFATLCDVLIDCYTKIMALVNSPDTCGPGVEDLFSKADAKVRKILVAGLVRDFEDSSKSGIKSEIAGIGKMVMGGLMGN